jgi:KaiC/GvpD/RAD55 family RecA-like ATPase
MDKYDSKRRVGCCPNPDHNDDTPSCSYNPKTFSFHCFGCGFNSDIIEAYMLKSNLTFNEACKKLFEEAGMEYDFTECGIKSKKQYRYPKPEYDDTKDKVYQYWQTRGISKGTIDYLDIQQDKNGNTLFQYRDLNDVLVTCKVRQSRKVKKDEVDEKGSRVPKCWYLPNTDVTHILYNINKINTTQPLIICTGEGDCAAAIECGFQNSTSVDGGDQNTMWIAECWDWLNQFNDIILVHDNDESGKKYIKEVTSRLGEYRVKVVDIPEKLEITSKSEQKILMPIKDLNELLFFGGKDAVKEAIENAKESEIPAIVDYTDVAKFDMSDVDGFTSGLEELDAAIDKFYVGSTTVLTGITGSGKSSLISTLACQSVDQGKPVFIYSGELSNPSLKNWIDCVHAGQRNLNEYLPQNGASKFYKIKPDAFSRINKFYKGQMFFYRDGFSQRTDKLFSAMEGCVRRYGVKTVILDNMTSVDLDNNDDNKWQKQDEFIREIIEFSKKWQVACIVVLHPKKMDMVRKMTIFDLQGCVSSVNLAHRVISLYRVSKKDKEGVVGKNGKVIEPPVKYDVVLDVLKDRFGSGGGKEVGIYYDVPSKRFFTNEQNLDFQYAWDKTDYGNEPLPFGIPQFEEENEVYGDPIQGGS